MKPNQAQQHEALVDTTTNLILCLANFLYRLAEIDARPFSKGLLLALESMFSDSALGLSARIGRISHDQRKQLGTPKNRKPYLERLYGSPNSEQGETNE